MFQTFINEVLTDFPPTFTPVFSPQSISGGSVNIHKKEDKVQEDLEEIQRLHDKLNGISRIIAALGKDGGMFVENLRKILNAQTGEKVEVDMSGNVTAHY